MKFNKIELLKNLSNRADEHIGIAVSRFQNQPEYLLLQSSLSGGWSIAQCLDHLNSYGDYYLPQLQRVIQDAAVNTTPVFKSGWLGNYFSNMMEPSEKKYKAVKGHIPHKNLHAASVVAKFISQQKELLLLLQKAENRNLNRRIPITISPLIRLKAGDVFRFLIAHNERHVQQALNNH